MMITKQPQGTGHTRPRAVVVAPTCFKLIVFALTPKGIRPTDIKEEEPFQSFPKLPVNYLFVDQPPVCTLPSAQQGPGNLQTRGPIPAGFLAAAAKGAAAADSPAGRGG